MRRVLLSPRWLLGHVLALAAAVVCMRLGWWQWQRAQQTHSIQNLGYAVQWPAFAVFVLLFWLRVIRDQLKPPPPAKPRSRPVVPTAAPPPLDAEDPEDARLIAYNEYLRRLHEQEKQAR